MDTESESSSIFRFSKEHATTIVVGTESELLTQNGLVETEKNEEAMSAVKNFYERTFVEKTDPESLFGERVIVDEQRRGLPFPETKSLEKDGKPYVSLRFGDHLNIIVSPDVVKPKMGPGVMYEALPIKHIFLKSRNEKAIDMMSQRKGIPARNLLSFAARDSGFSNERTYVKRDGSELSFGPDVLLSFPTKFDEQGQYLWDEEAFTYLFLHENSHAALAGVDEGRKARTFQVARERDANALALESIRTVAGKFPEDTFFSTYGHKHWIEEQLHNGYDPMRLLPDQKPSFDTLASNISRSAWRTEKR